MSTKFTKDNINILGIRLYYDQKTNTRATEMSNLLKYESQHLRCKVQLGIDEGYADKCWSIGLVQACDHMYLENRYGPNGSSFWEFHPLKSGRHKMVNDSDGRQYPFYSLNSSHVEIPRGSFENIITNLTYEDHFYPTVAWELPYCGGSKLTDVIRKQDFWIWLVAIKRASTKFSQLEPINPKHDEVHILKTMRWRYNLHMSFDPHREVGSRLDSMRDVQDEQPSILSANRAIPLSALSPPHCNAAQSLIWYPNVTGERPRLLVPPKQIIVPWNSWVEDMTPGKSLSLRRPENCRLVGEWTNDADLGLEQLRLGRIRARKELTAPKQIVNVYAPSSGFHVNSVPVNSHHSSPQRMNAGCSKNADPDI